MTISTARYAQYPEFREKLDELFRTREREYDALFARYEALTGTLAPDTFRKRLIDDDETLVSKYEQRIEQLHQEYNVPVLSSWREAFEQTGQARYHDGCQATDRSYQATLSCQESQVVLTLHVTLAFPLNQPNEFGESSASMAIDDALIFNDLHTYSWEAVPASLPAAEQQEKGEANHER